MRQRRRQPPTPKMNLVRLIERFGTEDKCRGYLEHLRWPDGVICIRCGSKAISKIAKRNQYDCDSCRYQFSVTSGTKMHDTHLPLWKWFLCAYMMIESKKGVSSNQLRRVLNVAPKTAWYLTHRIRAAMGDDLQAPLEGVIEVDETVVGGKIRGEGRLAGRRNKTMIVGAVQRGGEVRLQVIPGNDKVTLHKFIKDVTDDGAQAIYTDSLPSYRGIGDDDTVHEFVNHMAEEWTRGDVHTNTVEGVWSLLKRSIIGSYHQLSAKHLPAYLSEIGFRYNNRQNPYLFRDAIAKLLESEILPYERLIAVS